MPKKKDYQYTLEELVEIACALDGFSSPAFQMYPNDLLGSATIQKMDAAGVGGYVLLLLWCWNDKQCGLDVDEDFQKLGKLTDAQWKSQKDLIMRNFKKVGKKLYNRRLLLERKKQVLQRIKSIKGGLASAESRKIKRIQKLTTLKKRLRSGKKQVAT